ncbi:DUF2997 domain-containing protein [Aneurinibacillus aneurinilyticus]|jgi:hypothetical protein|uniref:DUF2997 domain-containing protein n=1 Tax=Aneurinibacillus aneurinilyticus ATCC 12856 TaxID=649747 RepID=U1X564_ANEAE|nr:DUF2997 domain-containing protein [Aneurinibacillus aneurinilyticus]ERI09673.1 hypothetical protein HMPREF0083_02244 [Aneurinibacillus aneurinilyticus ATCC 12856]MCI1693387.1 DUF2997 domain-containing protein [Aneurinibacillus aneurinilyticus]MED0707199.1 DUF2997 domain-containing protein [Aneurinibacillus aneurinilyticus]MED0726522.1 DUF2997 domain-containing protein [Aneurinibacillus aneurinilyticus]MED0735208.1 DUF2997 domain-containing protein [Aneurinibacillus aneurinilyticus]
MKQKIQLRIFPDGRIQAETKGIKGERCTDYITILEEMLNAQAVEAEYTKEFYETEEVKIQQIQPNRLMNEIK